jgi:hypothetical protein
MAWSNSTPTVDDRTHRGTIAVGHTGIGGGFITLYAVTDAGRQAREFFVGGIPVYASVLATPELSAVGYITDASGGVSRGRNTVFVMDSVRGERSWTDATVLSAPGDGAATMLSLVPGNRETVHAVWGLNLAGGLDAEVIRLVTRDARHRHTSPPADLRVGAVLTHLKVAADKHGNVHVVYQTTGRDERPHVHYAFWSSAGGWNRPVDVSSGVPSRDPTILLREDEALYIAYSALIGMTGPYPRFATVMMMVPSTTHCASLSEK